MNNLSNSINNLTSYISQLGDIETTLRTQQVNTSDMVQQQQIANNIKIISGVKESLNETLLSVNQYYNNNLNSASDTLHQQTVAVAIIDKEMQQAKARLMYINEQKVNKLRLVEINDYYSSAYAEYTVLVKIIIATLLPVLILTVLFKKQILSSNIYGILTVIVIIIGLFFMFYVLISIFSRDKMNYQEYNFYFNKKSAPAISGGANATNPFTLPTFTCIGQQCCDVGYTYDGPANMCLPTN